MTHPFDVYEDRAGQYRWRLVPNNGELVADSGEGYGSKTSARDAAAAVADHVDDDVAATDDEDVAADDTTDDAD